MVMLNVETKEDEVVNYRAFAASSLSETLVAALAIGDFRHRTGGGTTEADLLPLWPVHPSHLDEVSSIHTLPYPSIQHTLLTPSSNMSARATAQPTRPDNHGSRTVTITPTADTDAGPSTGSPPTSRSETPSSVGVLRLRGAPARRQHVMWTSDTVDNEGMGKKKSKSRWCAVSLD